MDNKNTILLTVVAVATLLVTAVGATFAYFTAQVDHNNTITVEATTGKTASFISEAGEPLAFEVKSSDMLESKVDSVNPKGTDNSTMKVTLTGDPGTTCTYKLTYVDTSEEPYVVQVPGEFMLNVKEQSATEGTNYSYDKVAEELAKITNTITIAPETNETVQVWNLTLNFYNLNDEQKELADKVYSGYFQVTDVNC